MTLIRNCTTTAPDGATRRPEDSLAKTPSASTAALTSMLINDCAVFRNFDVNCECVKSLKFLNNPLSYNPEYAFVAHLSGVTGKEELFKQLRNKLNLPDYFGFNWDALFDCLRDFHWIEQQKIALVHDDLPKLIENELKIYLEILIDSINDWKEGEKHNLEVVFPER